MSFNPPSPDFADLLQAYIRERFQQRGSQLLARAVNERFAEQVNGEFISRNTIDNWCRGYVKSVREWEKLAAIAVVLGLSESEADQLLRAAGQTAIAQKRLKAERAIEHAILAFWSTPSQPVVANSPQTQSNSSLADTKINLSDANSHLAELQGVANSFTQQQSTQIEEVKPVAVYSRPNSWRWGRTVALALLTLALTVWWVLRFNLLADFGFDDTPSVVDDFSKPGRWDLSEATFVSLDRGRLWFDAPINQLSDWRSDVVMPQWNVDKPITHLRFTAGLDMPDDGVWGFVGVQTECYTTQFADDDGKNDWLLVYIGGIERAILIEYTAQRDSAGIHTQSYDPVRSGQSYIVDLLWQQGGLQVYLDDKPQGPVLPCLPPRQFNLNAGLDPGMQLRGYLDDLQIWQ